MKLIVKAIDFIKNIIGYFGSDPDEIETFLLFIGAIFSFLTILGSIICFVDNKIVAHSNSEKNQAKRHLKEYNAHITDALKNESVFFCEDDPKKLLFFRRVPINKYHSGRRTFLAKLKLSSYILLGEAGCGKSSIIKKDYLHHCNKFLRFWRIHTGIVYINQQFLNHGIIGINSLDEIINCVQHTKYRRIYLYIDGIDEFGEDKFDEIFKSFIPFSRKIKKVKITSRTNFAIQNIINHNNKRFFGFNENQRYIVANWHQSRLIELSSFLLKHLKLDKLKQSEILRKVQNDSKNWQPYISSPLLIKLYLYILLYGDQSKKIDFENKYLFYTQFAEEVILTQRKRQGNFNVSQIQKELDCLSVSIFNAFVDNKKYIQYTENIAALLKQPINGVAHFVHETFFEYFVARNYLLQLSNKYSYSMAIAALHQTYTNDFADFITSALNGATKEIRTQIVDTLLAIYYTTLNADTREKYSSLFFSDNKQNSYSAQTQKAVDQLSRHQFFILKYEIIFRLGRIDSTVDDIIMFLKFVYYHDKNIRVKEDAEYYLAVLRRCCAISSSFLGAEEIELDYVNKMLPYNKKGKNSCYIPNYDLANRSHTLLFYGDIVKANIFEFKDEATNNPFSLAFSKRIEHLATNLPEFKKSMDDKKLKKYYFRVFDLATIYTFMLNRNRFLSDEEFKIVSNTRVTFIDASDERNNIMQDMLDLILELNQNIKSI